MNVTVTNKYRPDSYVVNEFQDNVYDGTAAVKDFQRFLNNNSGVTLVDWQMSQAWMGGGRSRTTIVAVFTREN